MNKKVIVGILTIVLLVVGYRNILWGDDKIAYEIVIECAEESLSNPEDLKLVEAYLVEDKDFMVCKLNTGKIYCFWPDGYVRSYDSLWIGEHEINVSKVNRALRRYFN